MAMPARHSCLPSWELCSTAQHPDNVANGRDACLMRFAGSSEEARMDNGQLA